MSNLNTYKNKDRYIYDLNTSNLLDEIKNILKENTEINENFSLSKLHNYIDKNTVNDFRLNCFKKINSIIDLKKKIFDEITPNIYSILGMDLAIQKNLNLSIQMPYDKTSLLSKHTDYESGDSPFQWVLWIPITNSFSTNAVYMNNENGNFESVNIEQGKFMLFDPNTPHGNVLNTTKETRISVNIRLKNWFAPDLGNKVPDRQHGIYYEDFCFSESTIRAFRLIKKTIT